MRTHVLSAVFRRNVASYFSGVLGYLLIIAFVIAVAFLLFDPAFFTANLATLDSLSRRFPMLLLFIVPAITMTAWAEERKLGTDELLFTLPASNLEILLGKYLAVLAVYTVLLLFTIPHLMILAFLGDPDWGLIFTTYLGYWLSGAALLALGLLASAMTNSTTVAFVIGVFLCAIPIYLGRIPYLGDWLERAALPEKLSDFAIGTVPIASVVYFIAVAAFALYLNMVAIARRFWTVRTENGGMGWQMAVRSIAVLVGLWATTSMLSATSGRVDLTQERLFTLSDTTEELIDSIPNDRSVTIQAYLSTEVPSEFEPVKKEIDGLLRQLDSEGGRRIAVRTIDIEPASDEANEAELAGITPRPQLARDESGRVAQQDVYLGVTVASGFDGVTIPFFERGTGVEYQLARAIGTVSRENRLTVGILETDAAVMGGGGNPMMGRMAGQPWQIVEELGKQYEVKSIDSGDLRRIVDPEQDGPEIDALLAVLPSSLTDPDMDALVAYVETGAPVLLFDDPMPVSSGGLQLAPRQPKPSQGGPMGMQQGGGEQKADGGRATRLLDAIGIAWDYENVVFDTTNPHPKLADLVRPELVFISDKSGLKSAINRRHPITEGLQEVLTFFPGMVQPRKDTAKLFKPLLRSGKATSGLVRYGELVTEVPAIFGGTDQQLTPETEVRYSIDDEAHTVAAIITRDETTKDQPADAPPLNVVYVADVDMIGDQLFNIEMTKVEDLSLDNITFLMNAIDHLAGEDRYIAIRSRRPIFRTLSFIDARKKQIEKEQALQNLQLDDERQTQIDEFTQELQAAVDRIDADDSLSERQKRQAIEVASRQRIRRLALKTEETDKEFEQQRKRLERRAVSQERAIEGRTRLIATLLAPIPALLLGLFVLSIRVSDERRGADRDRIVPN